MWASTKLFANCGESNKSGATATCPRRGHWDVAKGLAVGPGQAGDGHASNQLVDTTRSDWSEKLDLGIDEQAWLSEVVAAPGFRLTCSIQRSCAGTLEDRGKIYSGGVAVGAAGGARERLARRPHRYIVLLRE